MHMKDSVVIYKLIYIQNGTKSSYGAMSDCQLFTSNHIFRVYFILLALCSLRSHK